MVTSCTRPPTRSSLRHSQLSCVRVYVRVHVHVSERVCAVCSPSHATDCVSVYAQGDQDSRAHFSNTVMRVSGPRVSCAKYAAAPPKRDDRLDSTQQSNSLSGERTADARTDDGNVEGSGDSKQEEQSEANERVS